MRQPTVTLVDKDKRAICKEETLPSLHRSPLPTSVAAPKKTDAMEFTSRKQASCIWIHLIHSRGHGRSLSMLVWMFCSGMSLTPLSLGLGHDERQGRLVVEQPAWRLDLRTVGFTGFAPKQETWGLHFQPNPLCFSDHKMLIATFITREDVKTLARRDNPAELRPDRLHGIFLDAQTAKLQNTKEWSVPRPRAGIIGVGDGRFAVLTPAVIALYSSSLDMLKELKLSPEQQSRLWDFHSSPGGKAILVEYHYPEAFYDWLDPDTLQPQNTPFRESLPVLSLSDDKEIASFRETTVKSKGFTFEATIRQRNGAERTVCREDSWRWWEEKVCGDIQFLSNEFLALTQPHGLNVVPNTGGSVLLKVTLAENEWLGRAIYPAADGKRFAIAVWEHKGGSEFFDISYHSVLKRIEVYDIPRRQRVYSLDAKKQKLRAKDEFGFAFGVALSPDGSLLAVLVDGVVEVYKLPS
jgi:hypothetical protein